MIKELTGDWAGVIADCSKAIQLDPKVAEAYYRRGMAKSVTGDKPGAKADFDQADKLGFQQESATDTPTYTPKVTVQ